MANVKVAIRVRPLNTRESVDGGQLAVHVEDKVVRIKNTKVEGRVDSRERLMEFGFDYCYWSVEPQAPNYASQEEVFQDLGVSVLSGATEGYNVCLFAYGQTGSGKTYTMIGTPDSMGLTPRICQGLFRSGDCHPDGQSSSRVEVSFLEIYNERVRDLLRDAEQKKATVLRVREHPETGPYVQGLSLHQVTDYKQALELLERGISNRITAATHIHDASSRSHAIFTIRYTQATLENNLPSEIVSKINLVDLAGSERADPQYCKDRITEGANINKSLVTLGIVISALAQNSQMFSSCQSINSVASEGDGSPGGSMASSLSGGAGGSGSGSGGNGNRRHCFIPYRDSVLTWLLKDSLGGNSRTIMIATVSPSCSSYNETLSTLRYAAHARNIVNKPRVNEDANVRLIRELREEINRLKNMLLSFEMQRNPSPSPSDERDGSLSDMVLQNELKVDQLTKDWSESWTHKQRLLEQYSLDIDHGQASFLVHSLVPHLIALDRDVLSTGVTFYHLREGITRMGPEGDSLDEPQIVLQGGASCEIENQAGLVTLRPLPGQECLLNSREVTQPCRLAQGAVITLGQHRFRFNHPAEAAVLRKRRRTSEGALNCSSAELVSIGANLSAEGHGCPVDTAPPWRRVEEQQRYVELLREEIQVEQRQEERELEKEQAQLRQQQMEIEQWIQKQKERLTAVEQKATQELGVQTDLLTLLPSVDVDGGRDTQEPTQPPVVVVAGNCKQVVQEELLRHHALRRAESHIRRKRLHYQLQRVARKRHLLEAKRELQRLVDSLPPGQEGPSSPDFDTGGSRGRPCLLRRHSFSADLLSRLFPQYPPIFSQFLRRNKSSEFIPLHQGSSGPRKYPSDGCLRQPTMRGRSHTLPTSYCRASRSRAGSLENLRGPLREKHDNDDSTVTCSRTKISQSGRGSLPRSRSNSQSKCPGATAQDSGPKSLQKHVPIISKANALKNTPKGVKTGSHGAHKGLETIRKVFSRSVGPGIKTALARVFRKPPSGQRASKAPKPFKAPGKLTGKPVSSTEDSLTTNKEGRELVMKATVSLDNLEQTVTGAPREDVAQKRWHSAEALSPPTGRWKGRQQDLAQWIEHLQEEEGNVSDCDSLFSQDSLSSAYAAALAQQLRQEEVEQQNSDSESVDSHMSLDSLTMENSMAHNTVKETQTAVIQEQKKAPPTHLALSSETPHPSDTGRPLVETQGVAQEGLIREASDEMPAEVYWSLCLTNKIKPLHPSGQPCLEQQPGANPICEEEPVIKREESSNDCHFVTISTPCSLSSSSVREPESILTLTDAWSSMDAADSPRCLRPSAGQERQSEHPKEGNSCNPDLSYDNTSGSEGSLSADSTEGVSTMLKVEKYWESDRSLEEQVSSNSSAGVTCSEKTLTLVSDMNSTAATPPHLFQDLNGGSQNIGPTTTGHITVLAEDKVQLVHTQKAFATNEMSVSKNTEFRPIDMPAKENLPNCEYMPSLEHPAVAYDKKTSVCSNTSDIGKLSPQSFGSDVPMQIDGSCGAGTCGYMANANAINASGVDKSICLSEDSNTSGKKQNGSDFSQIHNGSISICDSEKQVHHEPQSGFTPKSTSTDKQNLTSPKSSADPDSSAPGTMLAPNVNRQSLPISMPKSKDNVDSFIENCEEKSSKRTDDQEVQSQIKIWTEMLEYTKDVPMSVESQRAKIVFHNPTHMFRDTNLESSQSQEESHDTTCRKSRKRIQENQDAFTSSLKFPKRCHSPILESTRICQRDTQKDNIETLKSEPTDSSPCKDKSSMEMKSCFLTVEKHISESSVTEKNCKDQITAGPCENTLGTTDIYAINKKISEVVQEHIEMSVDSNDQETLHSVAILDSIKHLKGVSERFTWHSTENVKDYNPLSSQNVSFTQELVRLNKNGVRLGAPIGNQQLGSVFVTNSQDQTTYETRGLDAHTDIKRPRRRSWHAAEESLNKDPTVLQQQDIPKELQTDTRKSKRDIMTDTFKGVGKGVQPEVHDLSTSLREGFLSLGGLTQYTEPQTTEKSETHLSSVVRHENEVNVYSPNPSIMAALSKSKRPCDNKGFTQDVVDNQMLSDARISNVSLPLLCSEQLNQANFVHCCEKPVEYVEIPSVLKEGDLHSQTATAATGGKDCFEKLTIFRSECNSVPTGFKNTSKEIFPVDAIQLCSEIGHLSLPVEQTGKSYILEQASRESVIVIPQTESTSNSQQNETRCLQSSSDLAKDGTQNLDENGRTFSSHITIKFPEQKSIEKQSCNESSINNSSTLYRQDITEIHVNLQECPGTEPNASTSNDLIGNAETKVGQECWKAVEGGRHNVKAFSQSSGCIDSVDSHVTLHTETNIEVGNAEHPLPTDIAETYECPKQNSTQALKYVKKIELEVKGCLRNRERLDEGSQEILENDLELQNQECSFSTIGEETNVPPQDMLQIRNKSEVSVGSPQTALDAFPTEHQKTEVHQDTISGDGLTQNDKMHRSGCAKHQDGKTNKAGDKQKLKIKKFRRSQAMAPPSSSSDSTSDTSSTENIPVKMHHPRYSTRMKSGARFYVTLEDSRHAKSTSGISEGQNLSVALGQNQTPVKMEVDESSVVDCPSKNGTLAFSTLHAPVVPNEQNGDQQAIVPTQEKHKSVEGLNLNERTLNLKLGSPVDERSCKVAENTSFQESSHVSKQLTNVSLDNNTLKKDDAVLRFSSIDINPFIHSWQETQSNKPTHKNQVFGSAAEISSKYPLVRCPDRQIMRCCSVDNGLNVQSSPFNSHLSTYANSKGLSSTLSSVEDFKEQVGIDAHSKCHCSSSETNAQNLTTVSCSSSYSGTSGDLGNSSGLVDEIMLVYPSEQEPQVLTTDESFNVCDHSTQTTTPGRDLKRRRCHYRSSTQVEMDLRGKVPATWASLQNISEHLSELICNTSDLLGNIQFMRNGASQQRKCSRKIKTLHGDSMRVSMKDGTTQTVLDIGIQTDLIDTHTGLSKSTCSIPVSETTLTKTHEVNVIVKVIGPDSLSLSDCNNFTLSSSYRQIGGQQLENVKSMPDLRENLSHSPGRSATLSKDLSSKRLSLDSMCELNDRYISPNVSEISPKDQDSDKSTSLRHETTIKRCSSQLSFNEGLTPTTSRNRSNKQVSFTDRASSPILTVEAGVGRSKRTSTPQSVTPRRHCPTDNQPKNIITSSKASPEVACLKNTSHFQFQSHRHTDSSSLMSIGTISAGPLSHNSKPASDINEFLFPSSEGKFEGTRVVTYRTDTKMEGTAQCLQQRPPSSQRPKVMLSQPLHQLTFRDQLEGMDVLDQESCKSHMLNVTAQRVTESERSLRKSSSERERDFRKQYFESERTFQNRLFEFSDTTPIHTLEHYEDDIISVTPSECNTDILVSINPLSEPRSPEKLQTFPEDLPLHNKFSNWSGLSQHRELQLSSSAQRLDSVNQSRQHSQGKHTPSSSTLTHNYETRKDFRMREIERLQKEREAVMASIHLEMNPHQLTVEMTEAKLHYGIGETDALLKVLKTGTKELSPPLSKQDLYDKHRRSIDGLRHEREIRLQTCRRARSLSPSKQRDSSNQKQQIATNVNKLRDNCSRVHVKAPVPIKKEGRCPSEIELLLRDYSRAREEARTEIARARDRLRERTEQEKRRLQQQTLSQVVRDDLRFRNRVSSSTLCTGSSLSVASSPTSGYNSSNPVILRDKEVTGTQELGSKVVSRPPIGGSQSMRSLRTWTSAQDLHQEPPSASGSALSPSCSPSSPPSLRQRTLSLGSSSSLTSAYHDIASRALAHALAEVRLASAGDLNNLLAGRSAAGWRHQGCERGVQVFHKAGPRPTLHGFLGTMEVEVPMATLWDVVRDQSKAHLYHPSISSSWTRALDRSTQLVYMLSKPASFNLKQPRDFCCISTESKQGERWVLAMQSVYEESLPRPSADAVRAEVLPSAWILQPSRRQGQESVTVIYMLQVDLGPPTIPPRLVAAVARKQASVIADLDAFVRL